MHIAADGGVSTPAAGMDCGVPSGAAELGDMAGAAACRLDAGATLESYLIIDLSTD